ncbi:MAG: hypothetical protein D3903_21175 [Candidatus Electrothrix sp. GM3_4]|nr:hypothetical protein [Candidatus Electrothrix sp. GM3_4]
MIAGNWGTNSRRDNLQNQAIAQTVASCSLRGFCRIRRPYNPNFCDIDVDRALRARERAEERLAQAQAHAEDLDRIRAEVALQRAVARITVAQRTSL